MKKKRNKQGSSLSEFGPALIVFICMFLIPVIDMAFVPLRYMICQGILNEVTHRLSVAEKRSEAYAKLSSDLWWKSYLSRCGVEVSNPKLKLLVCGNNATDSLTLNAGAPVPDQWLPRGTKGPCVYSLELDADCAIAPLYKGESGGIPGFTSPITFKMQSRSQWENLGRNPKTTEYFINE